MMIADCIACAWGDHSQHIDYPSKPPKGVYGGQRCMCKGECETDGRRERKLRVVEIPPEEVERMDEEMKKLAELFKGEA